MARATSDRTKSQGRTAAARPTNGRAAAPAKTRTNGTRGAVKASSPSAGSSKEELRARVEKLERANATLRAKNKELRLAAVESAEQVDTLTVQLATSERRASRQARHEAPAETVATREITRPARGRRKVRATEAESEGEDEVSSDADEPADSHKAWETAGHAEA